ncbi:Uncharacterized protein Adt_27636 [Abeliophyllum distichum]|uniref:Uncharacterized protein n=1 Tax=Abeliophyllum distichum TaxID=126358 RepID=A0ABD1RWB4_9LAMI
MPPMGNSQTLLQLTKEIVKPLKGNMETKENKEGEEYPTSFDKLQAYRVIFKDPSTKKVNKNVVELRPHERILHLIVAHTINPCLGKFNVITGEDLWLMWKILSYEPPNLCHYMLNEMVTLSSSTVNHLKYGMAISEILDQFNAHVLG